MKSKVDLICPHCKRGGLMRLRMQGRTGEIPAQVLLAQKHYCRNCETDCFPLTRDQRHSGRKYLTPDYERRTRVFARKAYIKWRGLNGEVKRASTQMIPTPRVRDEARDILKRKP